MSNWSVDQERNTKWTVVIVHYATFEVYDSYSRAIMKMDSESVFYALVPKAALEY